MTAIALRDFAWLLATCPDDNLRDGKRAVRLATEACKRVQPSFLFLDALAAAYAEDGQFDEAERHQRRAIADLGSFPTQVIAEYRHRLDLYKQRKPFRETN